VAVAVVAMAAAAGALQVVLLAETIVDCKVEMVVAGSLLAVVVLSAEVIAGQQWSELAGVRWR